MCMHFNSYTPSSLTVSNQLCIVATPDTVSSFLSPIYSRGHRLSTVVLYLVVASTSATTPPSPSNKFPANATSHNTGDTTMTPPDGPTASRSRLCSSIRSYIPSVFTMASSLPPILPHSPHNIHLGGIKDTQRVCGGGSGER